MTEGYRSGMDGDTIQPLSHPHLSPSCPTLSPTLPHSYGCIAGCEVSQECSDGLSPSVFRFAARSERAPPSRIHAKVGATPRRAVRGAGTGEAGRPPMPIAWRRGGGVQRAELRIRVRPPFQKTANVAERSPSQ